jgi:HEAT repeat protein/energy-coupling factor transporter ATP-binding protein EcfA2
MLEIGAVVATTILPWVGEWATVTIASSILKNIPNKFKSDEVEKALKVSISGAEKKCDQLFGNCNDKFKREFLNKYFQSKVLEELQKPLMNQPMDLNLLVFLFEETVKNNPAPPNNIINQEFIRPWLEIFKVEYFKVIGDLNFQYAKAVYFKQLANWYDDVKFVGIDVRGKEDDRSQKLATIFVMQDVQEEKKDRFISREEYPFLETDNITDHSSDILSNVNNRQRQLWQQQRQWINSDNYQNKFPAQDLLTKNQGKKSVILGSPGSGKTTLMSYFAVVIAEGQSNLLGLSGEIDWLPILIKMRDYARYDNLSILEYYQQFCQNSLHTKDLPQGFFEHWLEDGRVLILLDGLDEIVNEGKRYEIVQKIECFLGKYEKNRVIVTSRPAGYRRDFFKAAEFPHYWLQPFDHEKINEFIDNWYDSRTPDQTDAKSRKDSIRRALTNNPRLQMLATNPLLLTIIVLIHLYQAELPRERYKLYERAVQTLLVTWDTTNKQLENSSKLEYLKNDDWENLMQDLAYWIHSHSEGITGNESEGTLIDRDELLRFLGDYIKKTKGIDFSKAKKEGERFIEFLRDRAGLLNEQGQDCYAFVHKTFQEYLCAQKIQREMEENSYDFQIILDAIKEHLHDAHWREVLLLLVAQQKKISAARAIRDILNSKSDYEQWLHRDLLFAGSCLAENPPGLKLADENLVNEILERLVSLEISEQTGDQVKEQLYQILCSLYETEFALPCLQLLQEQLAVGKISFRRFLDYQVELEKDKDSLVDHLITKLSDQDLYVRSNVAEALGKLGNSSDKVIDSLISKLSDPDEDSYVRIGVVIALGESGNSSERVIDSLISKLSDQDSYVRSSVAIALGKLGNSSDKVIDSLISKLSDQDLYVRSNVAEALGKLGNSSDRVIDSLLLQLSDQDSSVHCKGAEALGKLGNSSDRVIDFLLPLLSDQHSYVRRYVAEALGKLGNSSDRVIDSLISQLSDEDSSVRRYVAEALGKLGKQSPKVKILIIEWLEQHKDTEFVGNGIDVLWYLVNS